jgi:hypothetical protein
MVRLWDLMGCGKIPYKWRFVAGKIIELNVMYVLRKLMKPGIFQQRCGKTMWKTFGFPFEISSTNGGKRPHLC